MTENTTEKRIPGPSLRNLMIKGVEKPLNIESQLGQITRKEIPYSEHSWRIKSKKGNLSLEHFFAALQFSGKTVGSVNVVPGAATQYGTDALDIDFASEHKSVENKPRIVHFGTYKNRVKVVGSPGTNVVLVTTEKEGPLVGRSGISEDDLDGIKSWFKELGFKITSTAPINFLNISLNIQFESMALVIDPKQV